jgi:hypothetical protein
LPDAPVIASSESIRDAAILPRKKRWLVIVPFLPVPGSTGSSFQ